MLDAVVQLLRNGLCCVKNLRLLEGTALWDAAVPRRYYALPPPLDATTPLEVLISLGQLYALVVCTHGGIRTMTESLGKLRRIERLMRLREQQAEEPKDPHDNHGVEPRATRRGGAAAVAPTSATRGIAGTIVDASLQAEADRALRSLVVGFLIFFIGCGFAWLVANSWHVTATDWMGGAQGLVHALTVQEVCLLPCLYLMLTTGATLRRRAVRAEALVRTLRGRKQLAPALLDLEGLELLTKWTPFWEPGVWLSEPQDFEKEEKLLAAELLRLENLLDELVGKSVGQVLNAADDLSAAARVTRVEGYREYIYFALNFCAFYGYLMGIVCFYWQDESSQPIYIRRFLLNMTVADADWIGNMAGDMAWTIEPIIILASPFMLEAMTPKKTTAKLKAD